MWVARPLSSTVETFFSGAGGSCSGGLRFAKKSELTAAISSVKSSDFVRGNVRMRGNY